MSDELKGYCVVQISKKLMQAAADVNHEKAATAVGRIIAGAVVTSRYQPCVMVKVEIVEPST